MMMGSTGKRDHRITSNLHHPFSSLRQALAGLALVVLTFLLTRTFDRSSSPTSLHCSSPSDASSTAISVGRGGDLHWPERGYGSRLSMRIYVYEEGEIDGLDLLMRGRDGRISAEACTKGQWGTQVKIHKFLLGSRFRTLNKAEADLFFVPSYVKCVRMMGGLNDKEINQTYVKVRNNIGSESNAIFPAIKWPRPHICFSKTYLDPSFAAPYSGAGAHLFRSWATFLNRSIILTPEGDRTDKRDTSAFNTWKDIIIPGNVEDGMTRLSGPTTVRPLPLSKRKYLANFLGRAQGKVGRLELIEIANQFPDKLESPELKFSGPDKLGRNEYFQHLRNAKFCLSPRGESSWTLRFYEAFFVFCGSDEEIEGMIARGREVRCLWVYAPDTEPCSAMLGILWELQRKVRQFHQSTETFWLHNRSIINRDLVPFRNWRTPVPLP
ncbi:hypothetical protein QJS04_geneDACA010043 [Acorus gramineus]|uniref:Uncharacterized protein n=1 Tax=Acorus gramineus TaxID=55184 RepID=A0AAV9BFQ5_ACOGR|nr:hypothetical protein QJS04_geneDACA010043 [Acorus gramineus]